MQVNEPYFLVMAFVFGLVSFLQFTLGRSYFKPSTSKQLWLGLPLILLGMAEATLAIGMARRAFEPHHISFLTLVLLIFSLGQLSSAMVAWVIQYRLHKYQSQRISAGHARSTRAV